jgi:hypothetical protein
MVLSENKQKTGGLLIHKVGAIEEIEANRCSKNGVDDLRLCNNFICL